MFDYYSRQNLLSIDKPICLLGFFGSRVPEILLPYLSLVVQVLLIWRDRSSIMWGCVYSIFVKSTLKMNC